MNREIRFRAWDNVDFKMLYTGEENDVTFVFDSEGIQAIRVASEGNDYLGEDLEHLIYMQYTGLNDRTGTPIYEGDIVKGFYWYYGKQHRIIGEVFYIGSGFRVKGIKQYKGLIEDLNPTHNVIGNIHENPELLEGEPNA